MALDEQDKSKNTPMKIPKDAYIPREKLTEYLLAPRNKNDKSRFLAQIGFTRNNPESLEASIRKLIAENDAQCDRTTEYGTLYRVQGGLQGVHGILTVVTIWILLDVEGQYRFVTLKPAR